VKINIIPDTCRIQIDGRFVPSEPIDQVAADFRRMLAEHLATTGLQPLAADEPGRRQPAAGSQSGLRQLADAHSDGSGLFSIVREEAYPPLDCPPDAPVARRLGEICREFNGQSGPQGVNYFADTGPFNQAGIDAVLFGPGDIAQAHTVDEYIELDQLYQAAEIILTLLTRHAGRSILKS
jgi:acetylornithine deacetylase/succinyl-diaminopimelate desuccinylase-like protein